MKHKIKNGMLWIAAVLAVMVFFGPAGFMTATPPGPVLTVPAAMGAGQIGQTIGENKIPLSNGLAAGLSPYVVPLRWGDSGGATGVIYNAATGAATTTYADAAIRFEQDFTTSEWFATVPSLLPSGGYIGIVRSGADGSEAKTDTDITRIYFEWDKTFQSLLITKTDVFVSF